ncbi:c-type cytochrome [Candidatus Solirubrobacter pratensis]|uniref:c-type cytochrome n=1 Tax=Candidatus Solirubrobacter pratensis TaxID=1298857 RepID=UPI000403FAC8|nr:cytochrome c [Candidatus Solirubrobacter pratensis]
MPFKIIVIAALAAALAGCGSKSTRSASSGEDVFASAGCANCHTLKAAGANGRVGPDLDQLKPTAAVVTRQVENGGGGMPAFKGTLTAAQIKAVANYVAANAGK